MNTSIRRILCLALCILLAAGTVAGCANTAGSPESSAAVEESEAASMDAKDIRVAAFEETVAGIGELDEPKSAAKRRGEGAAAIAAHLPKNLEYDALTDPQSTYNLHAVKNIHMLEMVTGEYSRNRTKSRYGVGGTDLGIIFGSDEKLFIAFGDTFLEETMEQEWRSNVLAYTTDFDYTDGITFDGMIERKPGMAKELLRGRKIDNIEMTKIPTGGIQIGDALYLSFMSVKHWGTPGGWDCNYGSVAKSVDGGETWEILKELEWPGDSAFCQMAPVIHDAYVYVSGITGGRNGPAKLMRVPVEQYEEFDAYEYLTALSEDGTPVWTQGSESIYEAMNILNKPVGEMSFLYSEYLEEWIVSYFKGEDLVISVSKELWGPYSRAVTIGAQKDFPGLYGAFMHPAYVSEDGKKIAFLMSLWTPVYNTALMEMELERK